MIEATEIYSFIYFRDHHPTLPTTSLQTRDEKVLPQNEGTEIQEEEGEGEAVAEAEKGEEEEEEEVGI